MWMLVFDKIYSFLMFMFNVFNKAVGFLEVVYNILTIFGQMFMIISSLQNTSHILMKMLKKL